MELENALKKVKNASRKLSVTGDGIINKLLNALAENLEKAKARIISANENDLIKISKKDHIYDRILLNEKRIDDMAKSVREIASYDSPINIILEKKTLKNGLALRKISTPLGVVGAIFEARPNVVIDTFALCLKSKNSVVMKGGSQCEKSNIALVKIISETINGIAPDLADIILLLSNDRIVFSEFIQMSKYVDVLIPRGGQGLIDFVKEHSLIPIIETGRGVCHTFFDKTGDTKKGAAIIYNAKTDRPSVCNALDTLIIHESRLKDLSKLCAPLLKTGVEIHADDSAYRELSKSYPPKFLKHARNHDFGTEYLALKMSIKTVSSLEEAIDHINEFGSGHSDAIITEESKNADLFLKAVDSACVYVNASTRFTDGGIFGLGAEVGISTQKLHARGPMGIKELTSYKWEIRGDGQVR